MSTPDLAAPDPLIGRLISGRYLLQSHLAAGGMGVVYKAEQQPLGRTVALKILEMKQGPKLDEMFSRRFFLEAAAAARLAHPNTIVVHDYGKTEDNIYFIAMEYLGGGTLGAFLKKNGPLTAGQAIYVSLQICSSLRDAHEQGLVHRDLKPGNVMFAPRGGDPFFVKVLDFGLVKVVSGDQKEAIGLTQSGVMMGSPRYMAPEQVRALPVDHRADIYSFGAVLYHMLTGAPPFAAGTAFEAMTAHVYNPPPPLKATWPGCPAGPALESVVMRCLEKDPAARFQSMDELMTALHGCEAEAGGLVANASPFISQASLSMSRSASLSASGSVSLGPSFGPSHGASGSTSASDSANDSQPSHPSAIRSVVSTSAGQSGSQKAIGSEPSRLSNKTMHFDAGPIPAPAQPAYAEPHSQASQQPPIVSARPARGSPLKWALAALVLLIVGGGAAALALVVPIDELIAAHPPPAQARTSPPATPAPSPRAITPPRPVAPIAPAPPVAPPVVAPAPAPTPAPVPAQITTLNTDPPGARVRHEGVDLGDTPITLPIPVGETWQIEVSLRNHVTRTVLVAAGQPQLTLHLEPEQLEPRGARPIARPAYPTPQVRQYPPVALPPTPAPQPVYRPPSRNVRTPDLTDPWNQ